MYAPKSAKLAILGNLRIHQNMGLSYLKYPQMPLFVLKGGGGGGGGVTRPCARARQAKRVLTQGRRGVQGRTGASRDK